MHIFRVILQFSPSLFGEDLGHTAARRKCGILRVQMIGSRDARLQRALTRRYFHKQSANPMEMLQEMEKAENGAQ
jgi:hypothetical protein